MLHGLARNAQRSRIGVRRAGVRCYPRRVPSRPRRSLPVRPARNPRAKLLWIRLTRRLSELALDCYPHRSEWQHQFLWSKAGSIAGGTDEIRREILARRLLALPRT
ncbi:MAG: hypothetical protein GEV12_10485 [Micromonosporaceae bacterium]|nr:hypothetical protein [Micromonosporaceae bacterium]